MPFASAEQEYYLKMNHPDIWRRWVKKYGHAPGYKKKLRQRKRNTSTKRKKRK
jgi:hypothetical protein